MDSSSGAYCRSPYKIPASNKSFLCLPHSFPSFSSAYLVDWMPMSCMCWCACAFRYGPSLEYKTVTKPKPSSSNDSVTTNASDSLATQHQQLQHTQSSSLSSSSQQKPEPGKAPSRDGSCRVCLKSFKQDDFHKTCAECHHKVCEDCASYSKLDDSEDAVNIPYLNSFHFFCVLFGVCC